MNTRPSGQALLIAVILLLVLTIVTVHMITVTKSDYDTAQVRRYTSNTGFHAEAGIQRIVEAMDQGLLNYEALILNQMKPLVYLLIVDESGKVGDGVTYQGAHSGELYQVTDEQLGIVAKAYGYKWLVAQYFNSVGSSVSLNLYGQKRVSYQMRTEEADEKLVTTVGIRVFVKGMTGATVNSEWLDTIHRSETNDLVDYATVTKLLGELEMALKNKEKNMVVEKISGLKSAMNNPFFLIEAVAQTKDGVTIYDTQQRLARVTLNTTEKMKVSVLGEYQWVGLAPEILSHGLVCYGEVKDPQKKLEVEGTIRTNPEAGKLSEWVKFLSKGEWGQLSPEGSLGPIQVVGSGRIDVSQFYDEKRPRETLLIIQGEEQATLYTTKALNNQFVGIILSESPLKIEGTLECYGTVLCDQGLEISGGTMTIKEDGTMLFKIGSSRLQRKVIEKGVWSGVAMNDVTLSEDSGVTVSEHMMRPQLAAIRDGRMVDLEGDKSER